MPPKHWVWCATLRGILTALHLLAFLPEAALSFEQPTRGALVSGLVPAAELVSAVSLQSIVFTGASTVGPALAGFGLTSLGFAGNFLVNAVSYSGVIGALLGVRSPASGGRLRTATPGAIREALRVAGSDTVLPAIMPFSARCCCWGRQRRC